MREYVHFHLAISPELADKFEELAAEWGMKRPNVLEKLVALEYKKLMRRRAAAQFPTLAQVEVEKTEQVEKQ